MRSIIRLSALAAAVFAIGTSVAQAAADFTFSQQGNDIVGVLSGTLDLKGAVLIGNTPSYGPNIYPSFGGLIATPTQLCCNYVGTIYGASGPGPFGTSNLAFGTATGSGAFEVNPNDIVVPINYSGGALDNTLTLANTTFADLGITPGGSFVYTLDGSGDTVTLLFSAARGVPEPATWSMMLLGFLGLGAMVRRRSVSLAAAA